jgi:hypothetical protein
MTATISPMESHIRLPVMKLPGIRFNPCPANTPPMITAIKPMVMRAMRPKLLFTLLNLPLTSSRSSESALDQGCSRVPVAIRTLRPVLSTDIWAAIAHASSEEMCTADFDRGCVRELRHAR